MSTEPETGTVIADRPPFSQIPHALTRDTSLSLSARVVYVNLMARADKLNNCFPGIRKIASDIGVSTSTARKAVKELEAAGWITVTRRGIDGERKQHKSNLYHLHFQPTVDTATGVGQESLQGCSDSRDVTRTIELEPSNNNQLRPADLLWDSFTDIHGQPASKTERGKYNKAVKLLREAEVEPDEYAGLVAAYAQKYDQLQPAIMTVATRIGEMRHYRDRGAIKVPSREEADFTRRVAALEAKYGEDGMERIGE